LGLVIPNQSYFTSLPTLRSTNWKAPGRNFKKKPQNSHGPKKMLVEITQHVKVHFYLQSFSFLGGSKFIVVVLFWKFWKSFLLSQSPNCFCFQKNIKILYFLKELWAIEIKRGFHFYKPKTADSFFYKSTLSNWNW